MVSAAIDLALAAGEPGEASGLLDRWHPSADERRGTIERLLRRFALGVAENDSSAAEAALAEAAARATADHLYWPFLEFPSALRTLRRQGHGSGLTSDALWGLALCLQPSLKAQSGLIEPLTDRELQVLTYLPSRSKNEEIAHDLFVSHNTLKTHLRSIYRKLGASERNEAIARATDLGLI
jgi:LuxR family maltose regulon positive regulatory protein